MVIYGTAFCSKHKNLPKVYGDLGSAFEKQGMIGEPREMMQKAHDAATKIFGVEHQNTKWTNKHLQRLERLAFGRVLNENQRTHMNRSQALATEPRHRLVGVSRWPTCRNHHTSHRHSSYRLHHIHLKLSHHLGCQLHRTNRRPFPRLAQMKVLAIAV